MKQSPVCYNIFLDYYVRNRRCFHTEANFSYSFPALRGIQAGKDYYVVMCPLKLIPRIFLFDEEEVPPEYRSQRIINKTRIPEITNYILENPKDYVFSSLTASVDGKMEYIPYSTEDQFKDIGRLIVSLDAKFLINDGQHRRSAIEEALKIAPELGTEAISIVFYRDEGLRQSQQMFADLNRHAVNTTSSLGILYEHRDQLANLTKQIVDQTDLLKRYTDMERVSLPKLSPKIFALNHIFNTNLKLLNKRKGEFISDQEIQFLTDFWTMLCNNITEWKLVAEKKITPSELRANYIVGHGLFLEAVGIVGRCVYLEYPTQWTSYISKLSSIDWNRSSTTLWLGRAYGLNGRIVKTNSTVQLTANKIKVELGLPLNEQELILEKTLRQEMNNDG